VKRRKDEGWQRGRAYKKEGEGGRGGGTAAAMEPSRMGEQTTEKKKGIQKVKEKVVNRLRGSRKEKMPAPATLGGRMRAAPRTGSGRLKGREQSKDRIESTQEIWGELVLAWNRSR